MIKFGTGGWRALIGEDFTKENVTILAQALANIMKRRHWTEKGFVIGFDRRFLSDKAAVWIAEIMAGNGINVYFIDKVAPTPLIMFTVKCLLAEYGCAVTASHNPADYNGVKVFTRGGRDAGVEATSEIENAIAGVAPGSILCADFRQALETGLIRKIDPFDEYIDTILGMIDVEAIKRRKLKVVLDPMHGVSKTCLQTILITARCELAVINDRHDTLFGGRLPSPGTQTLNHLKNIVMEKGYDIGIGTDGDADRLGIIDEKGNFMHPNNILVMLYYYLLKYKGWKGGVVRNIATTHLLDKIAEDFGEECCEVPVGFKYISAMMEQKNALIGGESSGGLAVRGHISGKDGIFAASLLIEILSVTGKSLSSLLEEIHEKYGYYFMSENDIRLDPDIKEKLARKLFIRREIPDLGYEIDHACYMDGLKIYFKNGGWIVARFSGTEPLLRIFAEMPDESGAYAVSGRMKAFLGL